MTNGFFLLSFALALALPGYVTAAPAVYGAVTVSGNQSAVAVNLVVKAMNGGGNTGINGLPTESLPCNGKVCNALKSSIVNDVMKGSLIGVRNLSAPNGDLNVNSVKLRGSLNVGNLNVLDNETDLILSIGGQANVNSISVGGK